MATKRQRALSTIVSTMLPSAPFSETAEIKRMANAPHLRHLPLHIAVRLCALSYVRHRYTDYDRLLEDGLDQAAARYCVIADMIAQLGDWGMVITETELLEAQDE